MVVRLLQTTLTILTILIPVLLAQFLVQIPNIGGICLIVPIILQRGKIP